MKIIIVTGLSGAGKSQATDALEDMGYYCIDNMPPSLIKNFLDMAATNKEIDKAAFVIDVRGGSLFDDLKDALEMMKKENVDFKILFFEATDSVLARRYNETRREHPLAHGESVAKGIQREKERLREVRNEADAIIDTSSFNNARLAAEIRNIVSEGKDDRSFTVNIMSFGYKNGMPVSADMVFDARFLPNPFYVEELKHLTGNDKAVRDYVMSHDIAKLFADEVRGMIEVLIPFYKKEGKFSLSVCFGCTGGHHRSVTLANDGKCAAMAEVGDGALAGHNSGAVIVLGTGIGGGVVLNRKVWMGATGGAGEFSWLLKDFRRFADEPLNYMNAMGLIWAGDTSAPALMRMYAERKNEDPAKFTGISFFEAYDAGDPDAHDALKEFGRRAVAGIYAVQSVLDLECYAIGGGISARKEVTDIIRECLQEKVAEFPYVPFCTPEIVTCRYGNDANLIGALHFHLDRIQ